VAVRERPQDEELWLEFAAFQHSAAQQQLPRGRWVFRNVQHDEHPQRLFKWMSSYSSWLQTLPAVRRVQRSQAALSNPGHLSFGVLENRICYSQQ
jgi:hypothetical protein